MAEVSSQESDRIRAPKSRALAVCEWICRICFTIVFIVNIHCAISFIVDPGPYAWNFGLRGDSGNFAVCGLGIAFLMWNATYPVFIALPNRFKVVGGIVLAQQLIGLIGESLPFGLSAPCKLSLRCEHHALHLFRRLRSSYHDGGVRIALRILL